MRNWLVFTLFATALSAAAPLPTVRVRLDHSVSGRDLILFLGGLFLLAKSTHEIHNKLEGAEGHGTARVAPSFAAVLVQIMLLDVVFSLDSVITAVGMVDELGVMIAAVVIAVIVMIAFAGPVSRFVDRHPTVKMLALSFLLLIGMALVADGLHQHIPGDQPTRPPRRRLGVRVLPRPCRRASRSRSR